MLVSPEPLASVDELQARMAEEMTEGDRREAQGALESLSDDARQYGSPAWLTPESTPAAVRRTVLKAAKRYMSNYEGFVQSRAGDETLGWGDAGDRAATPFFSEEEKRSLGALAGGGAMFTAPVTAWGTHLRPGEDRERWAPADTGTRWPMTPWGV